MKIKLRSLKNNHSGSLSFFVAFVLVATVLLFFFAVATPFLMTINTAFYEAGEDILNSGEDILPNIGNVSIRNNLQDSFTAAQDSTTENVNTLSFFYQYGWVFILVITIMAIFIMARKTVETKTIT